MTMDWYYFRRIIRVFKTSDSGMPGQPPRLSYWQRFWRNSYRGALPWLAGIALVVNYAEGRGHLNRWEMPGLDILVQSQLQNVPTKIFVVEITNDDYRTIFGSKSPLDPAKVLHLMGAILPAHPSVLGVDIDTRDPEWAKADLSKTLSLRGNTRVVWAQVPVEGKPSNPTQEPELLYQPTVGGQVQDVNEMGVVRFPLDADGVVRRHKVRYDLAYCSPRDGKAPVQGPAVPCEDPSKPNTGGKITMASFPRAVATAADLLQGEAGAADDRYLNFSGGHHQFQVVQASEFLDQKGNAKQLKPRQQRLLNNKMVLIGGAYEAAREEYQTSIGRIDGIELLANAIESEIGDVHSISEIGRLWEFGLDLVLGTVVVWLYFRFRYRPWRALFSVIAALLVLPFLASLLTFYVLQQWLSFVPVMAGMLIHQLVEGANLSTEFHKEKEKAEAEVRRLTAEIKRLSDDLAQKEADRAFFNIEAEKYRFALRQVESEKEKKESEIQKLEAEKGKLEERVKAARAGHS